ncbi:sigma-54-dependent transcriptional regulator [Nitrospira sp. Kam-Ns4a]
MWCERVPETRTESRLVLVVDDEPSMRTALSELIQRHGYQVQAVADGHAALAIVRQTPPWVVLTDLYLPQSSGLDVLREIKRCVPTVHVVVITAYGTVELAVEAMKNGASDVLQKPFAAEALEQILARLEEDQRTRREPTDTRGVLEETAARRRLSRRESRPLLGQSPAMRRLLAAAELVAPTSLTVLITGESGTGKELLARYLHSRSPRAHRPFIAVNCATLPDGLLESELFGYERGAFTGAVSRKLGKFELAHGGTLLLDEITEMNVALQAKLLRVLQERVVDRIGGREPVDVDIRVIATTNRDLWREVELGRFREDLFYRLNVFPIALPPLRERPEDIPLLARHFVAACAARNGLAAPALSEAALAALAMRPWRGNVRELENVMERAVLLAAGGVIEPEHVSADELTASRPGAPGLSAVPTDSGSAVPTGSGSAVPASRNGSAGCSLWEMERELIVSTLAQCKGNRTQAAKRLGISVRTLRNKLREYRQEGWNVDQVTANQVPEDTKQVTWTEV